MKSTGFAGAATMIAFNGTKIDVVASEICPMLPVVVGRRYKYKYITGTYPDEASLGVWTDAISARMADPTRSTADKIAQLNSLDTDVSTVGDSPIEQMSCNGVLVLYDPLLDTWSTPSVGHPMGNDEVGYHNLMWFELTRLFGSPAGCSY